MSIKGIGMWLWSIIIILVGIYIVKWAAQKWNIPGLSTLTANV